MRSRSTCTPGARAPPVLPHTPPGLLSTLYGESALPDRYPVDRSAIDAACSVCPGLPLFGTELASGNGSGNFDPGLLSGFTQATYLAAEVIQAAVLNISQVDVFALQSDYPGSWFDPTGLAHPVETLYTQVFPSLGNQLYATHLNVTANGEYAATFSNSARPRGVAPSS